MKSVFLIHLRAMLLTIVLTTTAEEAKPDLAANW